LKSYRNASSPNYGNGKKNESKFTTKKANNTRCVAKSHRPLHSISINFKLIAMQELFISVVTYNRSQIAIKSISDLLNKNKYNLPVLVQDDGSTEVEIKKFLSQIHNICNIDALSSYETNKGCEINNITRLQTLLDIGASTENFAANTFVYLTDDDMLYSNSFGIALQRMLAIMQNDTDILAGTLFNVKQHPVIKDYAYSGVLQHYVVKQSFGGCSVLIRVQDFLDAMQFYQSAEYKNFGGLIGWDWGLCTYARKTKRMLIATNDSYVQHTGITGVNSTPHKFDCAENFVI
jgi:glycosyltransferase involved in cell wall biosynthesis